MSNDDEQDVFLRQIVRYQADALTVDELAALEEDLVNDVEKRRLFIETLRRSSEIAEQFRNQVIAIQEDKPEDEIRSESAKRWAAVLMFVLAASMLLMLTFWKRPNPEKLVDRTSTTFAKITYSNGAVWGKSGLTQSNQSGDMNAEVPYELVSGAARLKMHGGGIVTLAAPTLFRGHGPNEIELVSGKIVARLPNENSELTVRVGEMSVRDQGTAFGITAETNGNVDLSVFQGSVAIEQSDGTGSILKRRIKEGKSLSTSNLSSQNQSVVFNATQYADIWPLTIGIDDASSIIKFAAPGPQQPLSELADSSKLLLIPEQLNQRILKPVSLKLLRPGDSWPKSKTRRLFIEPESYISSYMLVYIPEKDTNFVGRSISGRVSFHKSIVGVVIQNDPLQKSDQLFGVDEIDYGSLEWRRLERHRTHSDQVPPDGLNISADGKYLHFNWHVSTGHDCIRVLVDEGQEI